MRWPVKINRSTKCLLNHTDWYLIKETDPHKSVYLSYFRSGYALRSDVVCICTTENSLNRNADQMLVG